MPGMNFQTRSSVNSPSPSGCISHNPPGPLPG
ncbi:hypothetical protein [Otoolea muris]